MLYQEVLRETEALLLGEKGKVKGEKYGVCDAL